MLQVMEKGLLRARIMNTRKPLAQYVAGLCAWLYCRDVDTTRNREMVNAILTSSMPDMTFVFSDKALK